jgi:hypothetical protein
MSGDGGTLGAQPREARPRRLIARDFLSHCDVTCETFRQPDLDPPSNGDLGGMYLARTDGTGIDDMNTLARLEYFDHAEARDQMERHVASSKKSRGFWWGNQQNPIPFSFHRTQSSLKVFGFVANMINQ